MIARDLTDSNQHEAGDRTFVIGQQFADFIVAHPYVAGNVDLKHLADKIEADLADLYQLIWKTEPK